MQHILMRAYPGTTPEYWEQQDADVVEDFLAILRGEAIGSHQRGDNG